MAVFSGALSHGAGAVDAGVQPPAVPAVSCRGLCNFAGTGEDRKFPDFQLLTALEP